jgi:hypothetical protein
MAMIGYAHLRKTIRDDEIVCHHCNQRSLLQSERVAAPSAPRRVTALRRLGRLIQMMQIRCSTLALIPPLILIWAAVGGAMQSAGVSLTHSVTGSTVILSWSAPSSGNYLYRLEAGTAPGLTNVASAIVGSALGYVATNVPNGVYYVRVRAIASGENIPSNEVIVVVAGGGCVGAPAAPTDFSHTVSGSLVHLTWVPPSSGCPPSTHVITAGSAPGLGNLATLQASGSGVTVSAPNGTYYVRVFAVNAFGSSAPSNERVIVVGSAAPPPPPPAAPAFGPGQYRVNIDIAPGRYYSDPQDACYWERQRGFSGSSSDIIEANELVGDAAQWIVDILSTDVGFETDSDCGPWYTTPRAGAQSGIPPGLWLVGSQIAAGTYRVTAGPGCYWARLRNFTGNSSAIIDNDFSSSGGQQFVTILSTDVGFENDADCGTWTRVSSDERDTIAADPPDDIDLQWNGESCSSRR